eukprot:sb/3479040/
MASSEGGSNKKEKKDGEQKQGPGKGKMKTGGASESSSKNRAATKPAAPVKTGGPKMAGVCHSIVCLCVVRVVVQCHIWYISNWFFSEILRTVRFMS